MPQRPRRQRSEQPPAHHHVASDLPRHWIVLPQSVRARALLEPLTQGLIPTHVGFFPSARHHRVYRPQGLDQATLQYCVRGAGWCEIEGRRFPIGPGQLLVVPRYVAHAYGAHEKQPWTVHWVHVMGNLVDPLLAELGTSSERPVAELGVDTRLVALFEELQDALEDDFSYFHVLYASRVLVHLMGLMIRLRRERVPEIPNAEQRVLASIRQLKQGLGTPLDLARLAASASLSTSHYAALFRRLTGSSPGHYCSQLRIHRAAQLLSTTGQSIKAISHLLGYRDPLYFSRAFRRIQGVSPSRFRQVGRTQ